MKELISSGFCIDVRLFNDSVSVSCGVIEGILDVDNVGVVLLFNLSSGLSKYTLCAIPNAAAIGITDLAVSGGFSTPLVF